MHQLGLACIPTKTLLRPTEVRGETQRAAGVHAASLNWPDLSDYRDYMTSAGDDSEREANYASVGVDVVRGAGRLTGPGALDVDGRRVEADQILISTGSEPVIPPVPGLAESGYWTNR
jgi:pyruvate/2-oxoglutarate dehydrogenase complex dihydrolipoamide dehydrogenase (E3) component